MQLGICAIACALFSPYLLPASFRLDYTLCFLPLVTAFLYFRLFKAYFTRPRPDRRFSVAFALLAIFFAASFQFGACIEGNLMRLPWTDVAFWIAWPVNSVPMYIALRLLGCKLDHAPLSFGRRPGSHARDMTSTYTLFLGAFVLFLVLWAPVLLAVWPGIFTYDIGDVPYGAWRQHLTGELNNHKSVLFTFIVCPFLMLGDSMGNFNAGVSLFAMFQAVILALLFSWVVVIQVERRMPRWLIICTVAFFALNPLVSLFVVTDCADTLFGASVLLFMILLYRMGTGPRAWPSCVTLAAAGFLVAALRPNGVYSLLFAVIVCLICLRSSMNYRKVAASLLCAVAAFFVWTAPVASLLEVEDSSLQDLNAYTQPVQQVAYVYNQSVLSEEEMSYLSSLGWTPPNRFNPELGDFARASMMDMDGADRIKAWAYVLGRHPLESIEGCLMQTADAWSPYSWINYGIKDKSSEHANLLEVRYDEPAKADSKIPWLFDRITEVANEVTLQRVPFVALLVSIPMYLYIYLFACASSIVRRDRAAIAALSPCLLIIVTTLLGPAVITRYLLAIVFSLPFTCFMLLDREELEIV